MRAVSEVQWWNICIACISPWTWLSKLQKKKNTKFIVYPQWNEESKDENIKKYEQKYAMSKNEMYKFLRATNYQSAQNILKMLTWIAP